MVKTIRDNAVLISAILIFIAVVKQILFYNEFDISIVDYLTIGEMLTSIFDEVYFFIILIILGFIYAVVVQLFIESPKLVNNEYDSEKTRKFFLNVDIDIQFFTLLALSILIICLIRFDVLNFWWCVLAVIIVFQFVIIGFQFFNRNDSNPYQATNKDSIAAIVACFCVFIFLSSHSDANKKRTNKSLTQIVLSNDTLKCDASANLIYLGKTENYCFIYNTQEKSKLVIKMEDVKRIIIK